VCTLLQKMIYNAHDSRPFTFLAGMLLANAVFTFVLVWCFSPNGNDQASLVAALQERIRSLETKLADIVAVDEGGRGDQEDDEGAEEDAGLAANLQALPNSLSAGPAFLRGERPILLPLHRLPHSLR